MKTILNIPLPMSLLSEGNKSDHWSQKSKRNKSRAKWLMAYWKQDIDPPCKITFIRIAPRLLDSDNWVTTCKSLRDSISSRIFPGRAPGQADSDPRLQWEYKQEKGDVKQYALRIEIEHPYEG